MVEGDDGTNHHANVYSIQRYSGFATNVITNPTSPSVAGAIWGSPYPQWTRFNTGGPTPPPFLVFPAAVSSDPHGTNGHLYVYPDPGNPTVYGVKDLVVPGTTGITGLTIAYGSRVICLTGVPYQHPTTGGYGVSSNENINYTDPPLSQSYGNQESVLGAEWPWGYGAWGSVSVGELLLVKQQRGAVILYGDIANPTSAIEVPGVTPTGWIIGRAAPSPQGLAYCSDHRGAWLWNGGNTSTKISQQITDDFFHVDIAPYQSDRFGFYCEPWQDWMLFSHNWLYNSESNSWWVLYPTDDQSGQPGLLPTHTLFWYYPGAPGNNMYAAPAISSSSNGWLGFVMFDSSQGSCEYRWQSVPIHVVKEADRVIDIRQIVIRASDPNNTNNCHIQVSCGLWQSPDTSGIGISPTVFRYNVGTGAEGLFDIQGLTVHAWNTGSIGTSAPIIHSIDVGYQIRARKGVSN
jgi:hypothetical protein